MLLHFTSFFKIWLVAMAFTFKTESKHCPARALPVSLFVQYIQKMQATCSPTYDRWSLQHCTLQTGNKGLTHTSTHTLTQLHVVACRGSQPAQALATAKAQQQGQAQATIRGQAQGTIKVQAPLATTRAHMLGRLKEQAQVPHLDTVRVLITQEQDRLRFTLVHLTHR